MQWHQLDNMQTIQIGSTFLVLAHPGSPGQRAVKWVCVCVCTISIPSRPQSLIPDLKLNGKYSLESTDPRESEIRAPPQPLPYLMPIPPTRFFITNSTY